MLQLPQQKYIIEFNNKPPTDKRKCTDIDKKN